MTAVVVLSACERRDLYVYGDEFHSVELRVDWRGYSETDPQGMTVWFYPLDDPSHKPYSTTTASVRSQSLYLPGGRYQGVVIDYSPQEFSRQEFLELDQMATARVEAVPAHYQPDAYTVVGEGVPEGTSEAVNAELYADVAWTNRHSGRPAPDGSTGLYTVLDQPEQMALDTLKERTVAQGEYGEYIPWEVSDSYQTTIDVDTLYSAPGPLIWVVRIRVYVTSGFNSLWKTFSSITGLADGHYLPLHRNSERPCLVSTDNWQTTRTGNDSGYLQTTVTTFGLRPSSMRGDRVKHTATDGSATAAATYDGWDDYYTDVCDPEELRLNLSFVLRDRKTLCHYHFNVGRQVTSYDNQLVLRVELGPDWPEPINLPDVEAYDGAGFGAEVEEWQEGEAVETLM